MGKTEAPRCLLDPKKVGGFYIYIPVWEARGLRGSEAPG